MPAAGGGLVTARHRGARAGVFGEAARGREIVQVRASIPPTSSPLQPGRHAPGRAAAREWLAEREAELLPVPYFHVVYTLPAQIADIAYQNKAVIYDLLFRASAETTLTIAADPKHLGARIGFMSVLHTWGSALTQNPHSIYQALSSP